MWATICTSLSHNNISTQKTHRFTCTPHDIHELTLTKAQAYTHTTYAQHSHRSLSYTHRHIIPVSTHKELGHLCRDGDFWHSLISNLDTEPGPQSLLLTETQPPPPAALLIVFAKDSHLHPVWSATRGGLGLRPRRTVICS